MNVMHGHWPDTIKCDNRLLQFVLGFWVNGVFRGTGPVYQARLFFTFVEGRNGGLVD